MKTKTLIHIPKTAGTALQNSDYEFDGSGNVHKTIKSVHVDEFKIREFFTIVRNPYSRYVSMYNFYKNYGSSKFDVNIITFERFIKERIQISDICPIDDFCNQKEWAQYFDGKMIHILRQEHLDEDASNYFNTNKEIKHINTTTNNPMLYIDYYNDELISLVENYNKVDIDYFGFSFDTGATRNYYGA